MVPTYREPYAGPPAGDLRIGWASWDENEFRQRSIKWAYRDTSGKISRGCPELPFRVLVDMVLLAHRQGELEPRDVERIRTAFTG